MSPSPFHGIFSAFGQDNPLETADSPELGWDKPVARASSHQPPAQQASGVGQIAVDIYEQDNYYIVRAPIAGVRLSDLDIEVDDKILTIRGTRRLTDNVPENQYYIQECFWGEFSRSITLPFVINPQKVKATFSKDSILKILIPKEEKVKIIRVSEI